MEQLLESDDELPGSYNDDLIPAAYENDNRFNTITFKWIDNPAMQSYLKRQHLLSVNKIDVPPKNKTIDIERKYIRNGFLCKQDLLCLKCIAETVSDNTVLWFADFLVRKDLQSKYVGKFKSCLVNCGVMNRDSTHFNFENNVSLPLKKYKICVKV